MRTTFYLLLFQALHQNVQDHVMQLRAKFQDQHFVIPALQLFSCNASPAIDPSLRREANPSFPNATGPLHSTLLFLSPSTSLNTQPVSCVIAIAGSIPTREIIFPLLLPIKFYLR